MAATEDYVARVRRALDRIEAEPSAVPASAPGRAGDEAALLGRLRTFRPTVWFAKPDCISALECARRGWRCVAPDVLVCEGCRARVSCPLSPDLSRAEAGEWAERHLARLEAAHSASCPWRGRRCPPPRAGGPSPSPPQALAGARRRLASFAAALCLPPVEIGAERSGREEGKEARGERGDGSGGGASLLAGEASGRAPGAAAAAATANASPEASPAAATANDSPEASSAAASAGARPEASSAPASVGARPEASSAPASADAFAGASLALRASAALSKEFRGGPGGFWAGALRSPVPSAAEIAEALAAQNQAEAEAGRSGAGGADLGRRPPLPARSSAAFVRLFSDRRWAAYDGDGDGGADDGARCALRAALLALCGWELDRAGRRGDGDAGAPGRPREAHKGGGRSAMRAKAPPNAKQIGSSSSPGAPRGGSSSSPGAPRGGSSSSPGAPRGGSSSSPGAPRGGSSSPPGAPRGGSSSSPGALQTDSSSSPGAPHPVPLFPPGALLVSSSSSPKALLPPPCAVLRCSLCGARVFLGALATREERAGASTPGAARAGRRRGTGAEAEVAATTSGLVSERGRVAGEGPASAASPSPPARALPWSPSPPARALPWSPPARAPSPRPGPSRAASPAPFGAHMAPFLAPWERASEGADRQGSATAAAVAGTPPPAPRVFRGGERKEGDAREGAHASAHLAAPHATASRAATPSAEARIAAAPSADGSPAPTTCSSPLGVSSPPPVHPSSLGVSSPLSSSPWSPSLASASALPCRPLQYLSRAQRAALARLQALPFDPIAAHRGFCPYSAAGPPDAARPRAERGWEVEARAVLEALRREARRRDGSDAHAGSGLPPPGLSEPGGSRGPGGAGARAGGKRKREGGGGEAGREAEREAGAHEPQDRSLEPMAALERVFDALEGKPRAKGTE